MSRSELQPSPITLRNTFYVLRHGESQANVEHRIVSSPTDGVNSWGLTQRGRDEVRRSVSECSLITRPVRLIVTSDFARARETANIAAELLSSSIEVSADLRERYFGQWDGQSNTHYAKVWEQDESNADGVGPVESVLAVARRTTRLVSEVDRDRNDETILLVSHGDPLQILIAAVGGMQPSLHRRLKPLQTAELRPLDLTASLP